MLRRIIQPFGRYQVGELREYPIDVWRKLAKDGKRPLDEWSEVIAELVPIQTSTPVFQKHK